MGFRAPLLGHDEATYEALAAKHFTYDTSKTNEMGYWPQRERGIWNFPLAQLRIAGTGKRTLSMDYNFYFAQSGGKEEPALSKHRHRISAHSRLSVSVIKNGKEVLKSTHDISTWKRGLKLSDTPHEARALTGNFPEAHRAEHSPSTSH